MWKSKKNMITARSAIHNHFFHRGKGLVVDNVEKSVNNFCFAQKSVDFFVDNVINTKTGLT